MLRPGVCLPACLSVRLSQAGVLSKTVKCVIMRTTLHDSLGIICFSVVKDVGQIMNYAIQCKSDNI